MKKRINKGLKRALATTMVASMTMSALSLSSSAYSGAIKGSVDWSREKTIENSTEVDGNVTTKTKVTVQTGSNAEWDEIVRYKEVVKSKEVEDRQIINQFDSKVINVVASSSDADYSYEEGSSKESILNLEYPEITVTLEEGKSAVGKAGEVGSETKGDVQDGDDDPVYDYYITTDTQRVVTATMSNATKTILGENSKQSILDPVIPNFYYGRDDVWNVDSPNRFAPYLNECERPSGYNFQYTGWGDESIYFAAYAGNSNELGSEIDVLNFKLTDKSDSAIPKDIYTYCVDVDTSTQKGFWYKLENLEDAGYYEESVVPKIRAVVNNGYWGTIEKDSNGKEIDTVVGSLARLKRIMKESQNTGLSDSEIDAITEGEALTATQLAIWKYGKHEEKNTQLELYTKYTANFNPEREMWTDSEIVKADVEKRINAIVGFLTSLDGEETTSQNSTEIINEDKFVDQLKLTVKDRNSDGTYNVDVAFSLKVTPDAKKDDLTVRLISGNEEIASAKLTGDDCLIADNGVYTLSGLKLSEGDVNFKLELTGSQVIERGVYIYKSEVRDNYLNQRTEKVEDGVTSQTFVSIAEGTNDIDVDMNVVFDFTVKEGTTVIEHFWRNEELNTYNENESESSSEDESSSESETESSTGTTASDETTTASEETTSASVETTPAQTTPAETTSGGGGGNDDDEPRTTASTTTVAETTAPETTVPAATVPETVAPETVVYRGVEIPKEILDQYPGKTLDELYDMGVLGAFFEKVPTGLLPATNDATVVWTALSVLSGLGLAGVTVIGKKREDEE